MARRSTERRRQRREKTRRRWEPPTQRKAPPMDQIGEAWTVEIGKCHPKPSREARQGLPA